MHHRIEPHRLGGGEQVTRAVKVGHDHAAEIVLLRVGAIRGEVKDPVGASQLQRAFETLAIAHVDRVHGHVIADLVNAPRLVLGTKNEVHVMAVGEQPSRKVGADEAAGAGDDGSTPQLSASRAARTRCTRQRAGPAPTRRRVRALACLAPASPG